MPLLSSRKTEIHVGGLHLRFLDTYCLATEQIEEDFSSSGRHDAWLVIDKTVRKVDEDKVRDHMDDIDTLLVFVSFSCCIASAS